jgi:hypothetical protein
MNMDQGSGPRPMTGSPLRSDKAEARTQDDNVTLGTLAHAALVSILSRTATAPWALKRVPEMGSNSYMMPPALSISEKKSRNCCSYGHFGTLFQSPDPFFLKETFKCHRIVPYVVGQTPPLHAGVCLD